MNNWNIYRIKDICEIKSGKRLPKGCDFSSTQTQYPYIRARDIKNGKINTNDLAYISQDVQFKIKRYIVNENDIAITIVANIGDVGFVPKELDGFNLTENAVRLTNFHKNVNSKYLCYYLSQPNLKTYMEGFAVGAAQAKLGIYKIEKLKVQLPPLPTQQKIASILSAYDNLIQHYKKQIEVLQTAASELYKEWFVRFRFPGYKITRFENGIPEGWKIEKLGKFVDIKRGGSPRPIQDYISDEGLNWLKISDATAYDYPFIFNIEEHILESGLKKTVLLKSGSLVLSNSATPGLPRILCVDSCIHDGWLYFEKSFFSNEYLYLFFQQERTNIVKLGNGAIFTNLKTDILKEYKCFIPDNKLLKKFQVIIQPYFEKIKKTQQQITNLTQQCDFLLPRLMSGKLEVE